MASASHILHEVIVFAAVISAVTADQSTRADAVGLVVDEALAHPSDSSTSSSVGLLAAAVNELGSNQLGEAADKGLGLGWEVGGGDGSGCRAETGCSGLHIFNSCAPLLSPAEPARQRISSPPTHDGF